MSAEIQSRRAEDRRQQGEGPAPREGGERRLLKMANLSPVADLGEALTTKSGDVFALCGLDGDIDVDANPGHGLYFHDTRFLDRSRLRINGEKFSVLLSRSQDDRSICQLANAEMEFEDGGILPGGHIGIRRVRQIDSQIVETLEVSNFSHSRLDFELLLTYSARFDNMWVVRGAPEGLRGKLHPPVWSEGQIQFAYDGADGRRRVTRVELNPPPHNRGEDQTAIYSLSLAPGQRHAIEARIALLDDGPGRLEISPPHRRRRRISKVRVQTANQLFDRVLQRSFDDLSMLEMRERGEYFFAAGIPWFVALFGRDSIITALQTLAYDASIAGRTLELLAHYQGRRRDPWRDEEPGKILHELRVGEKPNLREVPQSPYYGTVDATPLFLILLAEYVQWTGDLRLARKLRGNIERALRWMDECADHDGDGFVDYVSQSAQGLFNQGWKDSGNAICHHDGVLARPPIALVEVQGYVYRARTEIARLLRHMGEPEAAERQEQSAADLRRHFEKAFWMPEREFLALALEEGGRQVDSLTSNAGQALWGGIVEVSQAAAVAERLLERRFFSGWGVRTLATSESAYNPTDYQVGSVWPHDNSLIVSGLNDYGHHPAAVSLFTATFEAAALFPDYRLPEVFAGFSRDDYAVPVRYPVACRPQAWAAGALPYMLISCLGLRPHALEGGLEVRSPHLPEWLPEVTVRELRCGDGVVDLRFERNRDATTVAVVRRQGDIRLRVEY